MYHNCTYIKNKEKQPVLLEVRIVVTFEHAGDYWKLVVCVCGASGDTVNMDSDLGACYIRNCDMFTFLYAYCISKQNGAAQCM